MQPKPKSAAHLAAALIDAGSIAQSDTDWVGKIANQAFNDAYWWSPLRTALRTSQDAKKTFERRIAALEAVLNDADKPGDA